MKNLNFDKSHIFKVSFFTKFTFFKHQILGNYWGKSWFLPQCAIVLNNFTKIQIARFARFLVNQCQNESQVSGIWKIKGLKRQIPSEFLAESQAYLRVRLARKGKKDRQHFSFVLRPVQCVWRRASRVVEEGKTNLTLRVIDWQEKKQDTNQWSKRANVQNWTTVPSHFLPILSFLFDISGLAAAFWAET